MCSRRRRGDHIKRREDLIRVHSLAIDDTRQRIETWMPPVAIESASAYAHRSSVSVNEAVATGEPASMSIDTSP